MNKLTIIDKYILKRYLATFSVMLLLFVPIGIIVDVSEKVNMMIKNQVPLGKILIYYFRFLFWLQRFLRNRRYTAQIYNGINNFFDKITNSGN